MLDFLSQHELYLVLGIVLAIWVGIIFYLSRLEKRIKKIEKNSH